MPGNLLAYVLPENVDALAQKRLPYLDSGACACNVQSAFLNRFRRELTDGWQMERFGN